MDDRIRYLRNVMGLWPPSRLPRSWEPASTPEQAPGLPTAAAELLVRARGLIRAPDDVRPFEPRPPATRTGA